MKLVEKLNVTRNHGFIGIIAIIENDRYGRLLIMDGFGGIDSLKGGAVRFDYGLVVKLKNTDTLDSLNKGMWNDCTSLMNAVCNGHDNGRPILNLKSWSIVNYAKLAGLI